MSETKIAPYSEHDDPLKLTTLDQLYGQVPAYKEVTPDGELKAIDLGASGKILAVAGLFSVSEETAMPASSSHIVADIFPLSPIDTVLEPSNKIEAHRAQKPSTHLNVDAILRGEMEEPHEAVVELLGKDALHDARKPLLEFDGRGNFKSLTNLLGILIVSETVDDKLARTALVSKGMIDDVKNLINNHWSLDHQAWWVADENRYKKYKKAREVINNPQQMSSLVAKVALSAVEQGFAHPDATKIEKFKHQAATATHSDSLPAAA